MRWLGLVAALIATPAAAHDWYPYECCSGNDCAPLSEAPVERNGGYVLSDGRHIPYGQIKQSPDKQWHLCEQKWPAQTSRRKILCVFGPLGGF